MSILLLADSEPLFCAEGRDALVAALSPRIPADAPAAYVGASNGDDPAFFELARAAALGIGLTRLEAIPAAPNDEQRELLAHADLILLAGGDARLGLERMTARSLVPALYRAARRGATVVGISAGAAQLGVILLDDDATPALGLVPYVVAAHDEPSWTSLRAAVRRRGGAVAGVGVPLRGIVEVGSDGRLAGLRGAPVAVRLSDGDAIVGALTRSARLA